MNTFSDLIPRANNNNKIALFPKLIVNCHLPASDGQLLADRLVEAHESLPTLDEDETCTESYYHKQFIGRQVHLVDMCPGIVTQYKARQGFFVVKYYKESLPEPKERKRCKNKLEIVGKRALLPLLLRTANRDERGNEDNNGEGVNENNDANENDGDNAIGDRYVNGNGDDNAITEFGSAAVEG